MVMKDRVLRRVLDSHRVWDVWQVQLLIRLRIMEEVDLDLEALTSMDIDSDFGIDSNLYIGRDKGIEELWRE